MVSSRLNAKSAHALDEARMGAKPAQEVSNYEPLRLEDSDPLRIIGPLVRATVGSRRANSFFESFRKMPLEQKIIIVGMVVTLIVTVGVSGCCMYDGVTTHDIHPNDADKVMYKSGILLDNQLTYIGGNMARDHPTGALSEKKAVFTVPMAEQIGADCDAIEGAGYSGGQLCAVYHNSGGNINQAAGVLRDANAATVAAGMVQNYPVDTNGYRSLSDIDSDILIAPVVSAGEVVCAGNRTEANMSEFCAELDTAVAEVGTPVPEN